MQIYLWIEWIDSAFIVTIGNDQIVSLTMVKETILLKGLQFSQDAFNLNKNYAAKQNNRGKQFVLCNELMTWEELETKNNSTDE